MFKHTTAHEFHCCRTCFSTGDLGMQISVRLSPVNIYHGCLVRATPLTVFYRSFWNFADVFFMVWGCACGLDIIVKIIFYHFFHFVNFFDLYVWTLCTFNVSATPHTILYRSFSFSTLWTLSFSYLRLLKVYRQCVPCKHNSLDNFILNFMQLFTSFFHGLKMCIWLGFNPGVNFVTFPLINLSFFKFLQVWHQRHRSLIFFKHGFRCLNTASGRFDSGFSLHA